MELIKTLLVYPVSKSSLSVSSHTPSSFFSSKQTDLSLFFLSLSLSFLSLSLLEIMLQRRSANEEFAPPDAETLKKAREHRLMEMKMDAVLREIAIYVFFLGIIFFLSYQQRDPLSFGYGDTVRKNLLSGFENVRLVNFVGLFLGRNEIVQDSTDQDHSKIMSPLTLLPTLHKSCLNVPSSDIYRKSFFRTITD